MAEFANRIGGVICGQVLTVMRATTASPLLEDVWTGDPNSPATR